MVLRIEAHLMVSRRQLRTSSEQILYEDQHGFQDSRAMNVPRIATASIGRASNATRRETDKNTVRRRR